MQICRLSFAVVLTGHQSFLIAPDWARPYAKLCRSDKIPVAHDRQERPDRHPPALTGAVKAPGHPHLACSLHLSGPIR